MMFIEELKKNKREKEDEDRTNREKNVYKKGLSEGVLERRVLPLVEGKDLVVR